MASLEGTQRDTGEMGEPDGDLQTVCSSATLCEFLSVAVFFFIWLCVRSEAF